MSSCLAKRIQVDLTAHLLATQEASSDRRMFESSCQVRLGVLSDMDSTCNLINLCKWVLCSLVQFGKLSIWDLSDLNKSRQTPHLNYGNHYGDG